MSAPIPRRRWLRVLVVALSLLVVLVAGALLAADSFILKQARAGANDLSQQLGRPVEIGDLSVTLFTGAGIRLSGLRIGAGADEEKPLLQVANVRVRVALLRALLSFGKKVEVTLAEVEGLNLNVVRLPDGSTNLERLQRRMAEVRPPAPPPEPSKAPADLSYLTVQRAALSDARIAFIDRAAKGPRELSVNHLDVEARDLQVGRPLEVRIRAAVLAEQHNFELVLRSAPLPPSFAAIPERILLKVQPIELAPLAPFLPAGAELRAGSFAADFEMSLGGAVAGGNGPTRVVGMVRAKGLTFAELKGAKPLDLALDADLDGDALTGSLAIRKLQLDVGPAGLTGKGSASGLNSGTPRIEGLELVSHDLDPALLAEYYPPLRALAAKVSGPVGLSLRASGTQSEPALELKLDLTPVRLSFPELLAKAAGARAATIAHLKVGGSGSFRFDAEADLAGVDLRPGGSLAKGPGDRLQLRLSGSRLVDVVGQKVDLARMELLLPGGEAVAGKGHVTMLGAREVKFGAELTSAHLDLDRLLLPTKEEKKAKKQPLDPKTFRGIGGEASVRIDQLRVKKADLRNVLIRIRMREDELVVERGRLGAFGGEVIADGTRVRLAHPEEPFQLSAQGKGIDLGAAMGLFSTQKILSGRFDGKVNLTGSGEAKADLVQTLAGVLEGNVSNGSFHGKDLVADVAGPLAKALPFGAVSQAAKGGVTALGKDLPFAIKLKNGTAQLEKPIQLSGAEANISIGGGFRLNGALDLAGNVALSPQIIARITGGKVRPQGAIPVAFRLTGPAWKPSLQDLDLAPAVKTIVQQAGTAALGKALGAPAVPQEAAKQKVEDTGRKLEEEAKKKLEGLFR